MVPRISRAPLLPGDLTAGQENRVSLYLTERTGLSVGALWPVFCAACRLSAADQAHHRHRTPADPLDAMARTLARELSTTPVIAAFAIGFAGGLRDGIRFGHSNAVTNRSLTNRRNRERHAEHRQPPPAPATTAAAGHADLEAARRWARYGNKRKL